MSSWVMILRTIGRGFEQARDMQIAVPVDLLASPQYFVSRSCLYGSRSCVFVEGCNIAPTCTGGVVHFCQKRLLSGLTDAVPDVSSVRRKNISECKVPFRACLRFTVENSIFWGGGGSSK